MNKIIVIVIGVAVVLGGPAFAQQADSMKSEINFETVNGTFVPVFEVMGQYYAVGSVWVGGASGGMTSQGTSLRPAFMAPTTIDIPDGWYRFQIGESPLFNKKFDVVAQGGPQTWKLNAGNPWGFWGGWLIATVGFTAAVMGGLYWAGTPGLGNLPGADIAILMIGGVSVGSGGIVLMIPNYPSATRTQ